MNYILTISDELIINKRIKNIFINFKTKRIIYNKLNNLSV